MSLENFMETDADGVFYIGHSSALVRISKKLILFDPVWNHKPYGDYWTFNPPQYDCDSIIGKVDHCIVSHIHEDHLCDRIISKLGVPVSIMSGRWPLTDRLSKIAFTHLHPELEWVNLNEDVQAFFVPHAFNSIDSSVFLRSKSYCVYLGSDNFLDSTMLEKLPNVKIDVAFVPYAFIHWYPHLMVNMTEEEKFLEANRLKKQSLDQAQMFVKKMRPRLTIPFGSSLFYAEGPDHILNRCVADPEEFEGATPMFAGDYIISKGGAKFSDPSRSFKPRNFGPLFTDKVSITTHDLERLKRQVKNASFRVENHSIIVNGVVEVDTDALQVHLLTKAKVPYTQFDFDEDVFSDWIRGLITFEQAIGTRRFKCLRVPNVYNVKVFEFMNNFL